MKRWFMVVCIGVLCFTMMNRIGRGETFVVSPFSFPLSPPSGSEITRISVSETGEQGNGISRHAALSGNGRWVAFSSNSFNLTDEDQSPVEDVFVHDLQTGELAILSTVAEGEAQDGDSSAPHISADSGVVVWESAASNLVAGDSNEARDIFVRATGGTILRLSVNSEGEEGNGDSLAPDISANGAVMVFESAADNLVAGDTNGVSDIFMTSPPNPPLHTGEGGFPTIPPLSATERGGRGGEVYRVSVSSDGSQGDGGSMGARLSADGRFVVFSSHAANLVADDTNGASDIFVHEIATGVTERVSVASDGREGDGHSSGGVLSADGRYVIFASFAGNFTIEDSPTQDIFRHDRVTGVTELVSISPMGAANGAAMRPAVSADGMRVVFTSLANNLVANDNNGVYDIFYKDMATGAVIRLSESANGNEGNRDSLAPSISGDGRVVAFESAATNLVAGDTNGLPDIFVVSLIPMEDERLYLPMVWKE